jgi:transcriptional regulator NrdR family protein
MEHIVKRAGHHESFDQKKVYASVYAACLAVRAQANDAELIASEVTKDINAWLADKKTVSSAEIANEVARSLKLYNSDAAFLYRHHRDIS